jgi:hypothetical protein
MAADPGRALAAGLSLRPLEDTIADTWAWMQQAQPEPAPGWGMSADREAELLAEWSPTAS